MAARDRRADDADLLTQLDDLRRRHPTVIDNAGSPGHLWAERVAAMQGWYDAETARARRDVDEPATWLATREHCAAGQLPWLETYACWRAADAFLSLGTPGRAEGVHQLRAGYDLARRLEARGLAAQLESLARLGHIPLLVADVRPDQQEPRLAGLTPREREILDLLCRGLTYADMASTLVISEKTVSSHVSNLLRKTGTANRIELTRVVTRARAAAGSEAPI